MILDVVVPARAGSEGLPGKNARILVDRPLILHSVACGQMVSGVRSVLVSTDDCELASLARASGALVPELRPTELATSSTPMADVIRHASRLLTSESRTAPDFIALLDPTSPLREPTWLESAVSLLSARDDAVGVVGVSTPSFNPLWVGVDVNVSGELSRSDFSRISYRRRQDVPPFKRITGGLYLWRFGFAASLTPSWLEQGTHLALETPDLMSHSIDTLEDFQLVALLLESGTVRLPWMRRV